MNKLFRGLADARNNKRLERADKLMNRVCPVAFSPSNNTLKPRKKRSNSPVLGFPADHTSICKPPPDAPSCNRGPEIAPALKKRSHLRHLTNQRGQSPRQAQQKDRAPGIRKAPRPAAFSQTSGFGQAHRAIGLASSSTAGLSEASSISSTRFARFRESARCEPIHPSKS